MSVHVSLLHFYEQAPKCSDLERGAIFHQVYTCKRTGKACGPKTCPRNDFSDLFPSSDGPKKPVSEPMPTIPASGPTVVISRSSPKKEINQPAGKRKRQNQKTNIIRRSRRKSHNRPKLHLSRGSYLKRALVTYVDQKTGVLQRTGFDVVFSAAGFSRSTPSIIEFKVGYKSPQKTARFYFPRETDVSKVKEVIGSWFSHLGIHNTSAMLNIMGSPVDFTIDFLQP